MKKKGCQTMLPKGPQQNIIGNELRLYIEYIYRGGWFWVESVIETNQKCDTIVAIEGFIYCITTHTYTITILDVLMQ